MSEQGGLSFITSLSNLALWAGILVAGSDMLWVPLLVSLFLRLRTAYQLRQYNQDPMWEPAAMLSQDVLTQVFAPMVAMFVYEALGGQIPLVTPELLAGDWHFWR